MSSNVYTKNEILQELASKGFFVDGYTLDTFLKIWKIDAIYEDENKTEFYDKNALEMVLAKLFSSNKDDEQPPSILPPEPKSVVQPVESVETPLNIESEPVSDVKESDNSVLPPSEPVSDVSTYDFSVITGNKEESSLENSPLPTEAPLEKQNEQIANVVNDEDDLFSFSKSTEALNKEEPKLETKEEIKETKDYSFVKDEETQDVLSKISLSNGSSLIDELSKDSSNSVSATEIPKQPTDEPELQNDDLVFKDTSPNTLVDPNFEENNENNNADSADFDDLSLLSESFEAQKKFRDYIVSELHKKNFDVSAPKNNVVKADVSEKILNTLARSMAKKIAKQVSLIYAKEARNNLKAEEVVKANRDLERRIRELEKENKKLRLLLVESNRNLNSYKPSAFGLYKKLKPKKEK